MPKERRARIAQVLEMLQEFRPLLGNGFPEEGNTGAGNEKASAHWQIRITEPGQLAQQVGTYLGWMHTLLGFFRAVHIARLEVENRYQPEKHDDIFHNFSWEMLSPEERKAIPPLGIVVPAIRLTESDRETLRQLLHQSLPVKIVVFIEDIIRSGAVGEEGHHLVDWAAFLAYQSLGNPHAFVSQVSVANVSALVEGLQKGISSPGPALMSIFVGNTNNAPAVPTYLLAAAAQESRIFPAFQWNPNTGSQWVDRFSINANPQPEKDWPENEIQYHNLGGEEVQVSIPFTVVDYLSLDSRFQHHFLVLTPQDRHPDIIPLWEYWQLPQESRMEKLPYIILADDSGQLHRALVSKDLILLAEAVLDMWHTLQEVGGIHSSYAQRLLEAEKQKLEEEKQQEISAIREEYEEKWSQSVGQLTEEIVSRIAAGLLGQAAMPAAAPAVSAPTTPSPPVPPTEAPTAEQPAEAPAEEAAAEEEEEAISFDEPYIETPRCTSCGECININGQMFAYNENKQAYIKDPDAGTFRELVMAAEKCPVHIIHPGKPRNPNEEGLDELLEKAKAFM